MSTITSNPVLRVSRLNKNYGDFEVLRNLQLQVEQGAIHGLVGLNGSGKTTTLECVLGLQAFDSGDISILGHSPRHIHLNRGKVVAIFDSPSLNPNLTVRQSLQHAALLCGTTTRPAEEVETLLGIGSFSKFRIRNLSLGNKRRASIAQALLGNPELVLLDEPFNGLDAGGVDDVLQLMATINRDAGATFLLCSHQLPYLEQICSHIAILHAGNIALSGEKQSLLRDSDRHIKLRCENREDARQALVHIKGIELLDIEDQDYLHVNPGQMDAASINASLVNSGIAVSELVQQRASLDSLFRRITSETGS